MNWKAVPFDTLTSLTLTAVIVDKDIDEIKFIADNGRAFVMRHDQDCCEEVYIENVAGDINDLVGSPILIAEEATNDDNIDRKLGLGDDGYFTWTFYKLATIKGYVDIRWYGTSNGYYSESVDFYETLP